MRTPAKQANGWGHSGLSRSVVSEEEADSMLGDLWATLVRDDTQAPGKPVAQLHRILCHSDDLESMEKLARANGMQVRFEALRPAEGGAQ